eukprot:1001262_1
MHSLFSQTHNVTHCTVAHKSNMAQANSPCADEEECKGLNIVICGGGVIGCCTAYYLSQKPNVASITIIERYEIAGCASGKAGGFLAKDWCDGGWVEPLARKSFALHTELGAKYGHKYGYKQTVAYSVHSKHSQGTELRNKSKIKDLEWIDCEVTSLKAIGTKASNAQIHPRLFCQTLVELMKDKLIIKYGVVTRAIVDQSDADKVIGMEYIANETRESVACDAVVIALGPWSQLAFDWFPKCKHLQHVTASKANSIVIAPTYDEAIKALDGALFLNHTLQDGTVLDIEVYPRPDGSVYSCCHSNNVPLTEDPSKVVNEERDSQMIYNGLRQLSTNYTLNAKLVLKQACYLPASGDNVPLIGRITGTKNAFVGTGHTCWGILNGPATGLILSELIADGKVRCVKESALERWSPSRNLF